MRKLKNKGIVRSTDFKYDKDKLLSQKRKYIYIYSYIKHISGGSRMKQRKQFFPSESKTLC